MTVERTVPIATPQGLHARPGAVLVTTAGGFASDIQFEVGGRVANGKTIFGVLKLGARQGDHLTIRATGSDAQAAVDRLVACLEELAKEG